MWTYLFFFVMIAGLLLEVSYSFFSNATTLSNIQSSISYYNTFSSFIGTVGFFYLGLTETDYR